MKFLEDLRRWLRLLGNVFKRFLPLKARLVFQAVQVGLDAFILFYKTVRDIQAGIKKKEFQGTVDKLKIPGLSAKERLKLNAEMEKQFKHFVTKSSAD